MHRTRNRRALTGLDPPGQPYPGMDFFASSFQGGTPPLTPAVRAGDHCGCPKSRHAESGARKRNAPTAEIALRGPDSPERQGAERGSQHPRCEHHTLRCRAAAHVSESPDAVALRLIAAKVRSSTAVGVNSSASLSSRNSIAWPGAM